MLIIGEKLNGTLKKTAAAITTRDAQFIQDLARKHVDAGADYLDVNAGTESGNEPYEMNSMKLEPYAVLQSWFLPKFSRTSVIAPTSLQILKGEYPQTALILT